MAVGAQLQSCPLCHDYHWLCGHNDLSQSTKGEPDVRHVSNRWQCWPGAVGNGVAPFDGKLSVSCPGISPGKQTLQNFTIWGRANFANANAFYTIMAHQDVVLSANLSAGWHVTFDSRYGGNNFSSGNGSANLNGQTVSFTSAVQRLTGSHSLNGSQLAPLAAVSPFEFNFDQPIAIGASGQVWTLAEIIVDPPGGCCKS